jgi:hypothetical protein
MVEVSDDVIVEWARNHPVYRNYISNLDAIRRLYKTLVLGEKKVTSGTRKYVIVKINELTEEGVGVCVKGLVLETVESTYNGCPECKKKECEHQSEKIKIRNVTILVADDTASAWCRVFNAGDTEFKEGEEITVYGRTKKFREAIEINVDRIEKNINTKEKIDTVLNLLRKSNGVGLTAFKAMCSRFGVSEEEIKSYVIADESEGIVRVKE